MSIQEQFEAIRRQHQQGATIGDGMRASAKTAAWLGGLSLFLNSLPYLLPLVGACLLFFFRGCNVTPYASPAPSERHTLQPHTPAVVTSPPQRQSQAHRAILQAIQSPQPEPTSEPTVPASLSHTASPQSNASYLTPAPSILSPAETSSEQETADLNQLRPNPFAGEGRRTFAPRASNPLQPRHWGRTTSPSRQTRQPTGLLGMQPDVPNATSAYDESGIYETMSGATYVGTCQLPEHPSKRCKLVIHSIQDRGTNITATMSLTSGGKRRKFTGFVQGDELTLIPQLGRGESEYGFPTAWYGQKPRRIYLTLDGDGKRLSGSADVSNESFEFVPRATIRRPGPATIPALKSMDDGEELTWKITSRNTKPTSGDHLWQFKQTGLRRGHFSWLQGGEVKLSGSYRLSAGSSHSINLTMGESEATKTYRCRCKPDYQAGLLNLWIPKSSSQPAKADPKTDHLFTLEFLQ